MKDEEYMFRKESTEKAITARSARRRRTHNGKGGRVKFPSDNLTKKELKAMSGECKSYRMNDPMKWAEFKAMPDDLKADYIKLIRERFGAADTKIAEMLGCHPVTFSRFCKTLGIGVGSRKGSTKWDEAGWFTWVNGMPMPEKTEEPEEIPMEETHEEPKVKTRAIPDCGSMTFEGRMEDIANTLIALLGGANVHIGIQWDVMDEG